MSRTKSVSFAKPMLERLEDRVQPSFLLAGTVQQQLQPPVQAIFQDMQSAKTDLQAQFTLLTNPPSPITGAQAEVSYAKGAADYQRMLNDQHAIIVIVNADTAFIRAVAIAELSEGDTTDALLVFFGPFIHFDPTSGLTNIENQANSLINGNDVQTWINTDFDFTTPVGFSSHATWAQVTETPTF